MLTDSLAGAFASTRRVLAGIGPHQLDQPTPCALWRVGTLVNHVVVAPRFATVALAGGIVEEEDFAAGDFLRHYDDTVEGALGAFGADGALDRTVSLPLGDILAAALMLLISADQFTHGWDLARATGQPTDFDAELAARMLGAVRNAVTDEFRGEEGVALFGPVRQAPPGAGPADQLAAFLGRTV